MMYFLQFRTRCTLVLLLLLNIASASVPVVPVFWGTRLVDQQTTATCDSGRFAIEVLHRFGEIGNGAEDLWGVYAPSNISMGLSYGINSNIEVAFQTEKDNKVQEFMAKWRILNQTVGSEIPVSLTAVFMTSIDAHKNDFFGDNYTFTDRLFYSTQVVASRQFNYKWMAMMSVNYVHFNTVPIGYGHDMVELSPTVGYKLSTKKSLFVSYHKPWAVTVFNDGEELAHKPKDALCFGYESNTPTHNFQLFFSSRDQISGGENMLYTQENISFKNLHFGFNIRVKLRSRH